MFSSASEVWATPQALFDALNKRFNFKTDVCALSENAKCERFFSPERDGLRQIWTGVCWMNPPYGRSIGKWVEKAYESSQQGAVVVCLLPARTDTQWWHSFVAKATEIVFLPGRLQFGGVIKDAPFPSAIVVFTPGENSPKVVFGNV
jgi:phage N-6-adenine-methyltransferase